jgi:hypothetical protein
LPLKRNRTQGSGVKGVAVMTRALGRIGLVFLLAFSATPAAFGQDGDDGEVELGEQPLEYTLFPDAWWVPGSGNEGRKDVREVTLPPPPSGPAPPFPFCNPASPICP